MTDRISSEQLSNALSVSVRQAQRKKADFLEGNYASWTLEDFLSLVDNISPDLYNLFCYNIDFIKSRLS